MEWIDQLRIMTLKNNRSLTTSWFWKNFNFDNQSLWIGKLNEANLSSTYLTDLLTKSEAAAGSFNLETIRDNYKIIETQVTFALDSQKIAQEIDGLISSAKEKGIDTSESTRLLKLSKLSLERREFEQAYKRVKDAQLVYALEVKGEY